MNRTAPQVYLASSSPQRYRLLKALQLKFSVVNPDIDETPRADESPSDYVVRLALQKSYSGSRFITTAGDHVILGADTCVSINQRKLGKPQNRSDACQMLKSLSGEVHQVYSAVAVNSCRITRCVAVVSDVEFHPLDDAQIREYLASGESEGRAGAYAIQGRAASFVKNITGSLSSVIGMPIKETAELLWLAGVTVPSYEISAGNVLSEFPFERTWSDHCHI